MSGLLHYGLYALRLCVLRTGQSICVNQSGSQTKQQLGFLNAPRRATVQHFYEQILPIYISGILPIRYISNIVISAEYISVCRYIGRALATLAHVRAQPLGQSILLKFSLETRLESKCFEPLIDFLAFLVRLLSLWTALFRFRRPSYTHTKPRAIWLFWHENPWILPDVKALIWNEMSSDAIIVAHLSTGSNVNGQQNLARFSEFFTSIWWITIDMPVISVVEKYFRLRLSTLFLQELLIYCM